MGSRLSATTQQNGSASWFFGWLIVIVTLSTYSLRMAAFMVGALLILRGVFTKA